MKNEQKCIIHFRQRQTGAALATALIMLLVLTVVGVSALNTISMEETMAGNLRDQIISFQATETGLRDAETKLDSDWLFKLAKTSPDCIKDTAPAICDGSQGGSRFVTGLKETFENNAHNDAFWEASKGAFQYAGPTIYDVADVPAFFIEKSRIPKSDSLGTGTDSASQDGGKLYYTSTARGKGRNPNSVSMVQATTAVRDIYAR